MSTAFTFPRTDQGIKGGLFTGDSIARWKDNDGNWLKYVGPINGTQLAINPGEGEAKERPSKLRGQVGQNLDALIQAGSPQVEWGHNDLGRDLLALAVRGTSSDISETGASITAEDVTVKKGSWNKLANRNVDSGTTPVGTGDGGSPSYTFAQDGTGDFGPFDWQHGLVYIPEGSAIADGAILELDYTTFDVTGFKVVGNQLDSLTLNVIMLGQNRTDSAEWKIEVFEAAVEPTESPDFLSDDYITSVFAGPIKTPTGTSEPYTIEELIFATS